MLTNLICTHKDDLNLFPLREPLDRNCSRNEETTIYACTNWEEKNLLEGERKYTFPADNLLAAVAENVSNSMLACCHHLILLVPTETFTLHKRVLT
jgi:hypothetical protein